MRVDEVYIEEAHSLLGIVPVGTVRHIVRVVLDDGKLADLDGMTRGVVVKEVELADKVVGQRVLVVVLAGALVCVAQIREGGEDEDIRVGRRDRIWFRLTSRN